MRNDRELRAKEAIFGRNSILPLLYLPLDRAGTIEVAALSRYTFLDFN